MRLQVILPLVLVTLLWSCNETSTSNVESQQTVQEVETNELEASSFEIDCDEDLVTWVGGLPSWNSDSACCYKMAFCYSDMDENFELIWIPKNRSEFYGLPNEYKMNAYSEGESSLDCFALSFDGEENSEPEDEFDLYEYSFPFTSEVHKRIDGDWFVLGEFEISSIEEFQALKKDLLVGNK